VEAAAVATVVVIVHALEVVVVEDSRTHVVETEVVEAAAAEDVVAHVVVVEVVAQT
jgi:hypothetical protein